MKKEPKAENRIGNQFRGFADFLRERGVVGLAAGIIIGSAVTSVVRSLVDDVVNPLVGLFFARLSRLDQVTFHIKESEIRIGLFISSLLDFIIVAIVIYFGFKLLRLEKLNRSKDKDKEDKKSINYGRRWRWRK